MFYFLGITGKSQTIYYQKTANMRSPISAEEKLAVTLKYLATWEPLNSLKYQFHVHETTMDKFIIHVC